jgi:hypothetical protein
LTKNPPRKTTSSVKSERGDTRWGKPVTGLDLADAIAKEEDDLIIAKLEEAISGNAGNDLEEMDDTSDEVFSIQENEDTVHTPSSTTTLELCTLIANLTAENRRIKDEHTRAVSELVALRKDYHDLKMEADAMRSSLQDYEASQNARIEQMLQKSISMIASLNRSPANITQNNTRTLTPPTVDYHTQITERIRTQVSELIEVTPHYSSHDFNQLVRDGVTKAYKDILYKVIGIARKLNKNWNFKARRRQLAMDAGHPISWHKTAESFGTQALEIWNQQCLIWMEQPLSYTPQTTTATS